MELKEFITATLTEIQQGVQQAIITNASRGTNGAINPSFGPAGVHLIQKVEFDVAVTVAQKSRGSGDAGIKVVGINVGGKGSLSSEKSQVSRIKFSIPIIPPTTTVEGGRTQ